MNQFDSKIQDAYEEGLQRCIYDQYDQAVERFIYVQRLVPNFPFIDQNIQQCNAMLIAYRNYLRAIELMNLQDWNEALYHLDFIQTRLQPSFKNTQQLMQDCRRNIWLLQLCKQQNEALDQLNRRMQNISQIYDNLMRAHQPQPFARQVQNEDDYLRYRRGEGQIAKLSIYFSCQRDPKCLNSDINTLFKHDVCNTSATFNSDGTISCLEPNCQTYSITDAYFSCVTHKVGKREPKQNIENYEFVNSLPVFADFVENCLQRNNLTEAEQQNFRLNLPPRLFPIQWQIN